MGKKLSALEAFVLFCKELKIENSEFAVVITGALKDHEKKSNAIRDLMSSHIELVVEKDKAYFKIKNSKGKEKSYTSYAFVDFWKDALK